MTIASLPTFEELRRHVRDVLCSRDHLDPVQTPLTESVVTRRGKPCGLYFVVHGPRRVCNSAIWAGEEHRVLFYDSLGCCFAQLRLSEAPDPRALA